MSINTASASHTPTFHELAIDARILAVLDKLGIASPTPIQARAIPHGLAGEDVIGIAQTGTGKTFAFGIPMIQSLLAGRGFGLILLPTRELALQVDESIRSIGAPLGITTAVLIGGASMGPQVSAIKRRPHFVIATPGRLLDHLEQQVFTLDKARVAVFDEADRMLDMGFWPQIQRIVKALPSERQTMLFSATLSREITDLAKKHMRAPVSVEVAPPGTTAERVTQEFFIVHKADKPRLLEKVLSDRPVSTIVFTRTKHGARKVTQLVCKMGHKAAEIHGNRSLSQRKDALEGFKTGRYRVLVATDIAARGIDVKGVGLVVNFDMPSQTEDYVHRIGRTARAGAEGHAISFAMPEERRDMRDIERLIRQPLSVSQLPSDLPAPRAMPQSDYQDDSRRGSARDGRPRFGSRPPYRERQSFGSRDRHPRDRGGAPRQGSYDRPRYDANPNRSLKIGTVIRTPRRNEESEGKE